MRMRALGPRALVLAIAGVAGIAAAAEVPLPPKADAVRRYLLEEEYPEVIGDDHYRIRVESLVVADVDNDGREEVVLHVTPHYRQSATVQIFEVSDDLVVTRVREGLAPGPLRPVSGEFLDSHGSGWGVDFEIVKPKGDPKARGVVVANALEHFGGVVAYPSFLHADGRVGRGFFIDMSDADVPAGAVSCAGFEFSRVRGIAVGVPADQKLNALAAWVGEEIWAYRIDAARPDGFLVKKRWIVKAPADFNGFLPGEGLDYLNGSGQKETLRLELGES